MTKLRKRKNTFFGNLLIKMINRKSFITGIKGTKLSNQEISFLYQYKPWGIILFSRNLKNPNQVKNLTKNIRKIFRDKKYPIMIDQEGGRVNRLEKFISLDNLTSEYFGNILTKLVTFLLEWV